MDITSHTAQKVAAAIEGAGETTLGIASKTHIPRTTLLRRLEGLSAFKIDELGLIANALGVPVCSLIGSEGEDAA